MVKERLKFDLEERKKETIDSCVLVSKFTSQITRKNKIQWVPHYNPINTQHKNYPLNSLFLTLSSSFL
jgi:hypothetical protein